MLSAKRIQQALAVFIAAVATLCVAQSAVAQGGEAYKARLTRVPVDTEMLATVDGSGSLTAVLNGKKLVINGVFTGLKSPAADAHIHFGAKAVRGPVILDVPIPNSTSGTISASIDLTPEQVAGLKSSSLYIQINSQGAPAGNLWGWFLPEKK
jgi:CHRD domain